ncbi:MAG TPA: endopeptidase La [Bacteroidales bacterium]|nr:MAG: endopeptidase La [Bacteroidetes bacterium GWF2_33_38]HBF89142.1 endopeptidase La [Bacteroidales bacterium]
MNYRERKKAVDLLFSNVLDENSDFISVVSDESDEAINKTDIPEILPILPLRNTVLFPGVVLPITVGRDKSLKLIRDIYKKNRLIGTVAQKDGQIEDPDFKDIYEVGTVASIIKILEMPDDTTSVIIQGRKRFKIDEFQSNDPYFVAKISPLTDESPLDNDSEYQALTGALKDLSLKIIKLSSNIAPEASFAVKNIESSTFLINFISSNSELKVEEKQALLENSNLKERAKKLMEHLTKEVQMLELRNQIQLKVKSELDTQQREYLLHQQMKTIQEELGGNPIDREIDEMRKKGKKKKWSKNIEQIFKKEVDKLQRLNPAAGEYSVQLNYVQALLDLPWNEYTKDNLELQHAIKVLDDDHYGLEKVKERILEYLAVLKLKGDLKSPILCLYGPPGVGKTSLGKSIARALNRNYIRMSLGGLHDEAEIRGHRKTYIGAMPGRIIQNIKKAKSSNPVFILDEIDKVGNDYRGDPSAALLEVLDPEQNNAFYDNYLELEYDLSNVMFIATANVISSINPALRDRMEMINISGYIVEEKIEIAKKHLIPKQLEAHGISPKQIKFSKAVIEYIVENHSKESGVRELDKKIAKVVRRVAKKIAFDEKYNVNITLEDVKEYLGSNEYKKEIYAGNEFAGVVTGLAWTALGGEILYIETSLSKGKGNLTLTGNLGEVMKESAIIAQEYIKSHSDKLGLDSDIFEKWNVHVHVPEGAIPKDGPSAGITMATSLASAYTQRKVKNGIAMTGEITLRGKVLPVGGIKEKILAAKRANIKEIILSIDNKKDIEEINDLYIKGLTFHFVENIIDVFNIALLKQKVENPLKLS